VPPPLLSSDHYLAAGGALLIRVVPKRARLAKELRWGASVVPKRPRWAALQQGGMGKQGTWNVARQVSEDQKLLAGVPVAGLHARILSKCQALRVPRGPHPTLQKLDPLLSW